MNYTDLTLYRRLLRLARPYWLHIAGVFLLSLLQSPLALLTPLPLKIAVDSVVGMHHLPGVLALLLPAGARGSHTAVLVLAAGLFVAVALLGQLQQLGNAVLSTYTGEKLLLSFRSQLFRHVQRLSLVYHDTTGTSDSTYRIQYDATSIQTIAIDGLMPFISAAFTLAGMIYVTARIDWQLALVALAVSPVLVLVARAYKRRLRSQSRGVKKLESSALAVVQEVLAAVRVVKAFGQEEREQERFVRRSSAGMWARIRYAVGEGVFGLLVGLTTAVGTAAVLFIGMRHVQAGVLTLGELLLVMGYLAQLYAPLKTIGGKAASLQAALASAERAFALLDEAPDVAERPDARPLGRAAGAVTFHQVSFAYGQDRPALHDISFEIVAGTRLGIVGATGAGKTTLVSLLTRFYDPTDGQILLDGVDLRAYTLADLRNQFAIVLQEPVLFSTSIAENIAYGRPDAHHDEIVAAAKAANADDFIMHLPQGYETPVGERGMRLSGGERQRISLARAFLKDAPILILDEPTSSVDVKTEAAIMEAMERLMQGRTTVMIAHRLSTLTHCDARLEIEHGCLLSAAGGGVPACGESFLHTSTPPSDGIVETGEQAHGTHHGRDVALQPLRPPISGPLATFPRAVAEAVLAYRHAHPGVGARRAQVALQQDPALAGLPLPGWRTIHRAWIAAGLVTPRGLPSWAPTLDHFYRAQIAAKDGEIAAKDGEIAVKDELIVELRRRVARAEQHAARLEQKLADLRAQAEDVETQPVLPASHPVLLRRTMSSQE